MINAINYLDELEQKGFTKEQAKTSVNLWIKLMNENLANKNDLLEVKSEIKDVVHKMELMESRLTIKLGKIIIGGFTVLGIVLGFLLKA